MLPTLIPRPPVTLPNESSRKSLSKRALPHLSQQRAVTLGPASPSQLQIQIQLAEEQLRLLNQQCPPPTRVPLP